MDKKTAALLKRKREHLIQNFVKGKVSSFLESNAMLLDEYFQESFGKSKVGMAMSMSKNPYAIVALGGYGRSEQCIYSDVDVLFLFEKKVPLEAERLVQEIVYPLWDIGLDVGHCTRSINDCLTLAKEDFEVLTSLLDSRFLCGMSHLYMELNDRLYTKLIRSRSKKIMYELINGMKQRHDKLGDSTYLLEPNLKEGKGGLRDYHALLWAARVISDLKIPEDLIYSGFISTDEYQSLTTALSFIFSVRNRLHYLAGRKSDQLYFEYQTAMAKDMKFKKDKGQMPVERFLSQLHEHMEYIKQFNAIFFTEVENTYSRSKRKNIIKKKPRDDRIIVLRNMLHMKSAEDVFRSPILLVKIFEESARYGIPISAESRRLIKEFSSLVDGDFLHKNNIVEAFEYILITPAPTFNVLNEMLTTGILSRLIPEFGKIENRVQFDKYHLYPVDKHSLRTVQIIKGFGDLKIEESHRLYGKIYKEISHRLTVIMWAALLHDIGKGKQDAKH
ncbi:MAG: [protein-PII] uridylyltransferase, partial [Desulfobacterales bacterium]|nr:[protein-PII] uridylyltransferase [Desulfobacterales bacterium]